MTSPDALDKDEPVVVLMALRVKAVRAAGETDEALLERLQSAAEWEDWDVLEASVKR